METISKTYPRKPQTAVLLSMISLGLGQIYCGRFVRGLVLGFLGVSAASMGVFALLPTTFCTQTIGMISVIFSIGLWGFGIVDARRIARKIPADYAIKDYNRWYVYVLLVCLAMPLAIPFAMIYREGIAVAFRVTGDAMEPAIHRGERILVDRLAYRDEAVQRGDIAAFINPNKRNQTNIRRVAALPGDMVEFREGRLYVNGERASISSGKNELYTSENGVPMNSPAEKVPNGHCYMLADKRTDGNDSRNYGPIPLSDLIGKVKWIYWPRWEKLEKGKPD